VSRQLLRATACAVVASLCVSLTAQPASADTPAGTWVRPVDGPIARPFAAPVSSYGPGHRGVDLVAPPGTPVRAANDGVVAFAGLVAGSLHVVIRHSHDVRTSYSFLRSIAVDTGEQVRRGSVVGTAGGSGSDHAPGVLHFGLRIGARYVDPMVLFAAVDLAEMVHLTTVEQPQQEGYDTPALERRSLAAALRLERGSSAFAAEPDHDGGVLATVAGAAGSALGVVGSVLEPVGALARSVYEHTPLAAELHDLQLAGTRLLAWATSRLDCTSDTSAPASGGGSGHLLMAVGGINSATAPDGSSFALDTGALGYRAGEVRYFSYAAGGGSYRPPDTWQDLVLEALSLRDQLRAMQRASPGREVDLIAHSQGGVVVDAFLQIMYDPSDPTLPPLGTAVTLSSPHLGAPLATIAAWLRGTRSGRAALGALDAVDGGRVPPSDARAAEQLAESSTLVDRLWSHPLADEVDLTSVSGDDDVVVPADRTVAPGSHDITVDPAGSDDHSSIIRDPKAMAAVRLALEQRALPCTSWRDGVRGAIEPVLISRAEHTLGAVAKRAAQLVDGATKA
jgi:hypothetical protein